MYTLPLTSHHHITHRTLHPKLRVQPMRKFNMARHRWILRPPKSLIKHTLQPELRHSLVPINLDPHFKQPIRISYPSFQRTISTPYNYRLRSFRHDFKVVCDLCPDIVCGGEQFWARPELVRSCGGIAVLLFQVRTLVCVSCCPYY